MFGRCLFEYIGRVVHGLCATFELSRFCRRDSLEVLAADKLPIASKEMVSGGRHSNHGPRKALSLPALEMAAHEASAG